MAYATSNPPKQITRGIGAGCPSLWVYTSTDVHTAVAAADYFSNGSALGLRVGDVMLVSKSSATIGTTMHYVSVVTADGAASIASAILA